MPTPAISNRTGFYGVPTGGTISGSVVRAAGESLFVAIEAVSAGTADAVTSVTWDAAGDNQAFTLKQAASPYTDCRYALYELIAPTSVKTGAVLVTFAGSANVKAIVEVAHVTSATAATTSKVENQVFQSGTPMSNAVSSASGNLVLDFLCVSELAASISVTAGQGNAIVHDMGLDTPTIASSTKAGTTSVSMGWSSTSGFTNKNVHFLLDIPPGSGTPVSFSGPVPTRNGIVGTAANFTNAGFFAGSGTPFVYTLQSGTLPAGLTLSSSTGAITGTPTSAGTSSGIVIRATDTGSATADTNSYSIVIAATNASPTFPGTIANLTGTGGSAITPVNVSGQFSDTDALTFTASPAGTAWPSGLVVNSSTGIISGTVATSTTTGLKVRATDTASQTVDSNAFSATLAAPGASGSFLSRQLVNNTVDPTTGDPTYSLLANMGNFEVCIHNATTGALIGSKITGLTSNSLGKLATNNITGTVIGTLYRHDYYNTVTGFFGVQYLTAF